MFNFDSHEIKKDFSKDAVFEVKFAEVEFEFNMQTFFDAHFHLDWPVVVWFRADIANHKFFFLRDFVVVAIYHHVYEIPQLHNYPVVALELFLHSVELEVVLHVFSQSTWSLQVTHNLQKR